MDISKYVEYVVKEKDLPMSTKGVVEQELRKTFSRKYNAVCLDIDGTLVQNDEISDSMSDSLYYILRRPVPIIFITGRGENGLKDFVSSTISKLRDTYGDRFDLYKDIIGITNDGAFLFYSSGDEGCGYLDKCDCLVDVSKINKLNQVKEEFEQEKIINGENISFSYCSSFGNALANVRVQFLVDSQDIIDYICKKVSQKALEVTTGEYHSRKIIQIAMSNKGKAIEEVEKFLGIPTNSMLRIADQGDENGNDYTMLDCTQGFTVNTVSKSLNGCFPIFDEDGKRLKNMEATEYLIKHIGIYPTICLEKPSREKYIVQLAQAERLIFYERSPFISKYNQIFSKNFSNAYGFEDVFDAKSGAITFKDWEWQRIDDSNELKELFCTNDREKLKYTLDTDAGKILRGCDTYYYFLAYKGKGKDVSGENIYEWLNNNISFMNKASQILLNYQINNSEDAKLLLGVLDNVRNINLMMLNTSIIKNFSSDNILMSFDRYLENSEINAWYSLCNRTCELMKRVCFNVEDKEDVVGDTQKVLEKILPLYRGTVLDIMNRKSHKLNKVCFRSYREIDNFIENYITVDYATQKMQLGHPDLKDKDVNFIGIAYGGLELPILARNILNDTYPINTSVMKLGGKYKDRHQENSLEQNENTKVRLLGNDKIAEMHNIVADDNVLTGKTLQIALNLLFVNNVDVEEIVAVRYPSLNRVEQMFLKGHGAIDTTKFFSYIKGLLFPSPYSKLKNVENNTYLDELGVFNKSRDRILKYLYKNGRYSKDSEAADFNVSR